MAIYRNKSLLIKKQKTPRNKWGVALLCVFIPLLINLVFNLAKFINSFLLGTFGLAIYAVACVFIVIGFMFVFDKHIKTNTSTIVFITLSFVTFIAILHIATSVSLLGNFSQYLSNCYNFKLTAGGLISALLVYPFYFLMHTVGAFVFFTIALLIFVTLTISSYYTHYNFIKSAQSLTNVKEDKANKKEQKEEAPVLFDEKIFIKDEEEAVEDSAILEPAQLDKNKDRERILNLLGLKKQEENNAKAPKEQKPKRLFDIFKKEDEEGAEAKSTTQEKEKPPVFIHNEESIRVSGAPAFVVPDSAPKMSDKERKNLEFVYGLQGKEMPKEQQQKPTFDFGNLTKQPFNNLNHDFDYNPQLQHDRFSSNNPSMFELSGQGNFNDDQISTQMNDYLSNQFDKNDRKTISNLSKKTNSEYVFDTAKFAFDNNAKISEAASNAYDIYDKNLTKKDYQKNKAQYINSIDKANANMAPFNKVEDEEEAFTSINNQEKVTNNPQPQVRAKASNPYIKPTFQLLEDYHMIDDTDDEDLAYKAEMLEQTLSNFKIDAKVCSIMKGPAFTRFEMQMPAGVSVKRITNYIEDIAMSLESYGDIRTEIPIPGKNAFGVEVPNKTVSTVGLKDILQSASFQNSKSLLTFGLGKDITGESITTRLEKMPHLLVAGATNSGKSVCLNALIISLLYKASPEDLRFILIDPKRVEMTFYSGLPHLLIPEIITEVDRAISALNWAINEMERRFVCFMNFNSKNIEDYNNTKEVKNKLNQKMPYIVIIVDELADFMQQSKKEMEESIMRLTAKARAAGIYLVLATQRPSVDVVTGTIKANLPSRIAFRVSANQDSRTILGTAGAERLLGRGDMLFHPADISDPIRLQGAFISNQEIEKVVSFVKENNEADFDEEIFDEMFNKTKGYEINPNEEEFDTLLKDAVRLIIKTNGASISKLQRAFGIGYPRAGKIIDQMERMGMISPPDNRNAREIYITQQEFEERFGENL